MHFIEKDYWALILGGSSGFGLATAKKLSKWGMNICIVHRDRRGSMERIARDFDEIKSTGVNFLSYNLDALSNEGIETVLKGLSQETGTGKVHLLLHSIAFGSLKLIAPQKKAQTESLAKVLAQKLGLEEEKIQTAADEILNSGDSRIYSLAQTTAYDSEILLEDESMARTIYAMGTSLLTWTQAVFRKKLFSSQARVTGITSEGNEVAWLGYAAVSAAKTALESVSRSIAMEFGPHGIRSNVIQAGITDTPALRLIPGSKGLLARAKMKNPLGRTTQPEDVAGVIAMLCTEEANWVNGSIIRVDGGEKIAG